ncbi:MAG: hypothetical protein RLZZ501_1333, partial [Pseudomonadota bacterium]
AAAAAATAATAAEQRFDALLGEARRRDGDD